MFTTIALLVINIILYVPNYTFTGYQQYLDVPNYSFTGYHIILMFPTIVLLVNNIILYVPN